MKNRQLFICLVLVSLLLIVSSCMGNDTSESQANSTNSIVPNTSEPQLNTDNMTPKVSLASNMPSNMNSAKKIENLPEELYIESNFKTQGSFWSAIIQVYTFDVSHKTEFDIKSEVTTGDIKLSIKHKDSDDYIFDAQDTASLDEKVTLEEGTYSIIC